MENKYIASLLAADPQAAPRGGTDRLFAAPAGSFSYRGYLDQTVRFIEDIQLLQKPLWQKFVRVFTELPKPDTDDAGWRGEYWGKMMRGAAITYRYTQNPLLLRTMTETVRDMIAAAEQGGRISSYARERELRGWDMWSRKYIMLGLQYFYEICPDEALKKEVIACIKGEADVILATVGEEEGKKPITETSSFWHGQNSSSVLEPMVRLNNLTGEQKYLDFASYIVAAGGNKLENIFKTALENKTSPHEFEVIKAYE
ncbi:MAG: glycoside hydrolase family 127 protein, partial [Clostridia bacterium]|nr:glycoside hydrolase family 127 protein [Clostridia bacterium]